MDILRKKCNISGKSFPITFQEQELSRKCNLPLPELHPDLSLQRLMSFRNENSLYSSTCSQSNQQIISMFDPAQALNVFRYDYWEEGKYNLPYLDYDPNKSFIKQFRQLMELVPLPNLVNLLNENCDYVNWVDRSKDCYLISASSNCQDCYYGNQLINCQDCLDCSNLLDCTLCLECLDSSSLYDCEYCMSSRNLSNCSFCVSCQSCQDCFLCSNLRNKKYCILNKSYSKEEYQIAMTKLSIDSHQKLKKFIKKFDEISHKSSIKCMDLSQCSDSSGYYLKNCKNSHSCFDSHELEDCSHIIYGSKIKDCSRSYAIVNGSELCSNVISCFSSYNSHFSIACWNNINAFYSLFSRRCENVFACISAKNLKNAIFNKQYPENQYLEIKNRIIMELKSLGIYGNPLPQNVSPFSYRDTIANDYWPQERQDSPSNEVGKTFSENVKICNLSGKQFKLIEQEMNFYKKKSFPLPEICYSERRKKRLEKSMPRKLINSNCADCSKSVLSIDIKKQSRKIICQDCYLKQCY